MQKGGTDRLQPVVPTIESYAWTANGFGPQFGITINLVSADPATRQFQAVLQNVYPVFYRLYAEFLDEGGQLLTPS